MCSLRKKDSSSIDMDLRIRRILNVGNVHDLCDQPMWYRIYYFAKRVPIYKLTKKGSPMTDMAFDIRPDFKVKYVHLICDSTIFVASAT